MASRSSNAYADARRSKIRGVGSAERQRGYAWGSLSTQQRAHYGNQRNFQAAAETAADRQNAEAEAQRQEALREKGRQEVLSGGQAPLPAPGTVPTPPKGWPQATLDSTPPADGPPATKPVDPLRHHPERAKLNELAEAEKRAQAARSKAMAKARVQRHSRRYGDIPDPSFS